MPPPSFSHASAVVMPRAVQSWLKDLCQKLKKALLAKDGDPTTVASIQTMVNEQADSLEASLGADHAPIRAQISAKINTSLLDVFHGELEHQQQQKLPLVVDLLHVLVPVIGTQCIVMEWWDLVLRPLLKDAAVQNATANRARELVVQAMVAAPASAYDDEPTPTPVWPTSTEKVAPRKAGDAPYRIISGGPQLPTRRALERLPSGMPASSSLRSSSVGSAAGPRTDMYRRFAQRVFDLYLSETATKVEGEGHASDSDAKDQSSGNELGLTTFDQDETAIVWKGNIESTILIYSNQKPKEFFHHVSESFTEPTARVPLLCLLTTFLRLYPIHAYHITSTALPKQLVLSLQLDTSTTSTALGVTTLVMLMPHIPDWIANGGAGGLSTLLSIFARIVDWRKLGAGWETRVGACPELEALRRENDEEYNQVDRIGKRLNVKPSLRWRRLETTFDTNDPTPPNAEQLFTYLYGLFPCNVIRFLRAPIYYLRETMFESPFEGSWEDMIDELAIQSRTHPILRRHTLHPALISMDAERELTDKQRWMRHDSADINAECMSLFLGKWHDATDDHIRQTEMGVDDESISVLSERKLEMGRRRSKVHSSIARTFHHIPNVVSADDILLTYASLRSGAPLTSSDEVQVKQPKSISISAAATTAATSGVTASAAIPSSVPPSPVTHATRARARTRSGSMSSVIPLLPPSSPTSGGKHPLAASHMPIHHALPSLDSLALSSKSESSNPDITYVQRANLLLRNELNFELYLKEQHLRHIGKLHRDRLTDTALEAERQNLYHTVRSLRSQLSSMNTILDRQRIEATSTKNRHVYWETELNNKLKAYREERKAWASEARQLKAQYEEDAATIKGLSRQLEESGSELFELKTRVEEVEPKVARIEGYEKKLKQLSSCLRYWDEDTKRYERQRSEMGVLLARWEEMCDVLKSTEVAMAEAQDKALRLESDNAQVKAQLDVAVAKVLAKSKVRHLLPLPDTSDITVTLEKERDNLRRQNESLAEEILFLKAKLETDVDVPPVQL